MAADGDFGALWPLVIIAVGAAATYVWRAIGVAISGRIRPDSALFQWVACVTYALLAGLIARMILLPIGPLAATPIWDRIAAAIVALAAFFLSRKNLALGVAAGIGLLILLTWGRGALL